VANNRGRFQKGQSGNPGGRPKLPEDIRMARSLNATEFERIVTKYLYLPWSEIYKLKEDQSLPLMECAIISMLAKAIEDGDERKLGFLLDRVIGKVKERLEHSGSLTLEDLITGSMNELRSEED
jgi:hypothetical protein